MDLRRYNVIVLPDTWGSALEAIFNEVARRKLRSWVESGGTLIAMGGSAAFAAGKDNGLSAVRLREDVLDKLEVYQESLEREKRARQIKIDPSEIWGSPVAIDERAEDRDKKDEPSQLQERPSDESKKPKESKDAERLKREDSWQRMFDPHGSILLGIASPEHWLCFGVCPGDVSGNRLPVLLMDGNALFSEFPVQPAVRLAEKEKLRLSGLLWPEARQRLAETAYATVERVGNGQIILFASDPFFRGYWEGTGRMLLNAIILGPGMGTSQPIPW
jgi:hypothetical protein